MLKPIIAGAAAIAALLPVFVRDLVGLAGVGLVAYGAWLIMPAAGFITGGLLLILAAVLAALSPRRGA